MKKILICTAEHKFGDGLFHNEDIKHITSHNITINTFNVNKYNSDYEIASALAQKSQEYDLVIFPFHGKAMHNFLETNKENKKFQDFLNNNNTKKVVWTLDNHIFSDEDKKVRPFFDSYYVAHKMPGKYTEEDKWLPCSYNMTSIQDLISWGNTNTPPTYDVICIYRYFKSHLTFPNRNTDALKIYEKFSKIPNLKYKFCCTPDGRDYLSALLSAKVVINLSMSGDLNIRNFECLGLNKIMLADQAINHKDIKLDYRQTFFFKRDMTDFDKSLNQALNFDEQYDTRRNVLNNHTLLHRYIKIINSELDLNIKIINDFCLKSSTVETKKFTYTDHSKCSLYLRSARVYLLNNDYAHAIECIKKTIYLFPPERNELTSIEDEDYLNLLEFFPKIKPTQRISSTILSTINYLKKKIAASS